MNNTSQPGLLERRTIIPSRAAFLVSVSWDVVAMLAQHLLARGITFECDQLDGEFFLPQLCQRVITKLPVLGRFFSGKIEFETCR